MQISQFSWGIEIFISCAANAQTGFPPFGSLESGPGDAINRQNLNVNIPIPIVSGRGRGLDFQFAMTNNSLVWQNNAGTWSPVVGPTGSPTWGWIEAPVGFLTSVQSTGTCTYNSRQYTTHITSGYKFTEPDGTVHPFPSSVKEVSVPDPCPAAPGYGFPGYSSDNTGYYMDPDAGILYSASGIQYGGVGLMQDTNGNYISATFVNGSETDWTDTVGHTALKFITNASNIQFKFLDPTGAYQTTTANLQTFNVKTNFACTGVVEYTGTASLPVSVLLPNGQSYSISYEATPQNSGYVTGRISEITFPNGGYIQYQYGTTNDGINCTDGTVTNLTRTVNDGTSSYVWQFMRALNGSNWATTVTAPQMPYDTAANQSVFTFNSGGQLTSQKIYQGSASGGTLLRTVNSTWATNGSPATQVTILEDNTTQSEVETTYDSYDNLLTMTEHDYGSGAPGSVLRTASYMYLSTTPYTNLHILNRVTRKTIADSTGTIKYREDTAYDGTTLSPCPTGVVQSVNYGCSITTRGNPTSVTTYTDAATPAGGVTKNSYYDALGNLVQADVDCCQTMKWNFLATTQYSYPNSIVKGATGGPQLTTNFTYNAYTGQIASIQDPNNQTPSFAHDFIRRQTTITRPDQAQIVNSYDDTNHTMSVSNPTQGTSVVKITTYEDGLGQAIQTTTFDGSGTSYATTATQFDGLGREYKVSNPYTTSAQYWTQSNFDALGRQLKITLPGSSQITYSYVGPSVTTTDAAGHQRKMQMDGLGRLAIAFEPDPTNGNSLTLQTSYSYSVLDQLGSLTQGSQTRSWSYDGMARLTSQTLPESGTASFQYNSYNLMSQRTDARGVITTYSYDTLNRPYQTSYNVGTTGVSATPTVTYSYGTNASQYNNGRLLTLTDGLGTTTNTYDNLARVTQVQHVINGTTYNIGYQYNLAGEVASLTYPSNRVVQKSYDAVGRLSSLSSGTTTYANSFSYNSSFHPTNFTLGNGVAATLGYSPDRLQLQSLSYAGSSAVFGVTYGRSQNGGNNGQITSIADSVDPGRSVAYTYDALDRLSTAVTTGSTNYPKWGLSWTYDRYGNRTNQTVTAGTAYSNSVAINAATNRITDPGYSYDANGNLTNDGVNTITDDAENRMVSSAGILGSGTYSYRASGLRAVKVSGGTTTVYLFDGNHDIAEYSNGALANEYVYLGDRLLATHATGTLYYQVGDHQSSRAILDSGGSIVGQKGHYPFGEDWYTTSLTNRHFTSYERDSESTNDNALHRFFVNRLGRFSTTDPAPGGGGRPQGFNLYNYVGNDPVNRRDPNGLFHLLIGDDCYEGECPSDNHVDGWGGVGPGSGGGCENPVGSEGDPCPPNPVPPPPPPTPACKAELKFRRVKYTGGIANHAFWIVRDMNSIRWTLEGGPNKGHPFDVIGLTTLTVWAPSPPSPPHFTADIASQPTFRGFGDGYSDANVCAEVLIMTSFAQTFPNGTMRYDPFLGPNSNSIAHSLGALAEFPLSKGPPRTPGWNVLLSW
jgi:RHS repeat-associated protein